MFEDDGMGGFESEVMMQGEVLVEIANASL
jgi:hypothetical protein